MTLRRDYSDPKYKKWRKAVFVRDRWKCQMPGCPGADKRLNAHHIKKWASWPSLRFVVANGITLCWTCHDKIHGLEEDYESLFSGIVGRPKSDASLKLLMMRYEQRRKDGSA